MRSECEFKIGNRVVTVAHRSRESVRVRSCDLDDPRRVLRRPDETRE